MNPLLERISIDPNVCFGKPCVRGTRIWVSLLLDFLAAGASVEEILADYPQLTRQDVLAAIAYGAEMSRDRHVLIGDVLRVGSQCRRPRPSPTRAPELSGSRIAG